MKLTIFHAGRKVSIDLPDGVDVHLSVDGDDVLQRQVPKQTPNSALLKTGPSARKLYRWLVATVALDRTPTLDVDPNYIDEHLGLVPIALGRSLGALEKAGLVEVLLRRKEDNSRVVSYRVKLLDADQPVPVRADEVDALQTALRDIDAECGKVAVALFQTLCRLADMDGSVVSMGSLRDLCLEMQPVPNKVPERELLSLDREGWVAVTNEDPLCVKILAWETLRYAVDGTA